MSGWDFVFGRTTNGSALKWLSIVDEFTRSWLKRGDVQALYIEPGSPWENGYAESFHSRFRDEFLAMEEFETLKMAGALSSAWKGDLQPLPTPQFAGLPHAGRVRGDLCRINSGNNTGSN